MWNEDSDIRRAGADILNEDTFIGSECADVFNEDTYIGRGSTCTVGYVKQFCFTVVVWSNIESAVTLLKLADRTGHFGFNNRVQTALIIHQIVTLFTSSFINKWICILPTVSLCFLNSSVIVRGYFGNKWRMWDIF
jgi:hypothetical protein